MSAPNVVLSSWLSLCKKLSVGANLTKLGQKQF